MQVKATNNMAKLLQQYLKDYKIYQTKMSEYDYKMRVDIDIFNHDDDYSYNTNKFNVIVVEYPNEYYACGRYLTTKTLLKLFRASDRTLDGFIQAVKNEIDI